MAQSFGLHNHDRERVLEATDLVALIGEHVALKPAGREFKGLCPFHDDSNPSLHVAPHKNIYKCFACGAGGTAFDFVMNYHSMDFREALQYLADRAGITLTPTRPHGTETDDGPHLSTADLISAHQTAVGFYQTILRHDTHGAEARAILEARGITQAMIERFRIGAAPDRWDGLAQTLQKKKLNLTPFVKSGLLTPHRESDGYVDRFRNRLIFPIYDVLDRPVAIGARRIDPDDEPKYLNSPEHARFQKSKTLYGLNHAARDIQKRGSAVLVEGYTDVIACHQAGLSHVVAALGTALTIDHARVLQRLCNEVILVFDGDTAGTKAADRAVEIFFAASVDVRIVILPDDQDPADLLDREGGLAEFDHLTRTAPDAIDYLLQTLTHSLTADAGGLSQRQQTIEQFLQRLGELGYHGMPHLRRDLVLNHLSTLLRMPAASVHRLIPWPRKSHRATPTRQDTPNAAPRKRDRLEDHARIQAEAGILASILDDPVVLDMKPGTDDDSTVRDRLRSLAFVHHEYQYLLDKLVDTPPADLTQARIASWTVSRPEAGRALADLHALNRAAATMPELDDEPTSLVADDQRLKDALDRVTAYLDALTQLIDLHRAGPGTASADDDVAAANVNIERIRRAGGTRRKLGRSGSSSARTMSAGTSGPEHDQQHHPPK
ncbi:MAG: DNA primase [Planctomycetes bacterium]|nr:DNA primase [Planctomycetota bacterium]